MFYQISTDVLINIHRCLGESVLILNADGAFDCWPRVVAFEGEVFVLELEDVLHLWIDAHTRKLSRFAGKLQMNLVEVVEVDVRVARRVDEVARLKPAHLRHHHAEQSV